MKKSTNHFPNGKWTFDSAVTDCFTDMLLRSIPLWNDSILMCEAFASQHLQDGDTIVDVGCSRGTALHKLAKQLKKTGFKDLKFIGLDNSPPMLQDALQYNSDFPKGYTVEYVEQDLREGLPSEIKTMKPKMILSLWTAQFIPLEKRGKLINDCCQALAGDGVFMYSEKLRGQTSHHEEAMRKAYHNWKHQMGYSWESIKTKAESLEGVLVSLSAPEVKQMLMAEGFSPEEVGRYYQFALYYCVKK